METKSKIKNTTILMVMGFIFVAVAGIIFATSTWKYVPLVGKQIILAGISTGLYAFSFKVKKLEKTKTILFYLATVFLGFFSYSLFFSINNTKSLSLLFANIIMLFPALFWFNKNRKGIDLFVNILLVNNVYILLIRNLNWEEDIVYIGLAAFVAMFCIADYYKDRLIDSANKSLEAGFKNCFRIFVGMYLIYIIPSVVFSSVDINVQVAVLVLLAISTGISYRKNSTATMRVINSVIIIMSVVRGTELFLGNLQIENEIKYLYSYIVICIATVCLMRKELFYLVYTYVIFNTYNQLESFGDETAYIPYLLIFTLCLIGMAVRMYKSGKLTLEKQGIKFIAISFMQIVISVMMFVSAAHDDFIDMTGHLFSCSIWIMAGAILAKKRGFKSLWYTFALIAGIFVLISQPFINLPGDFAFERGVFCIGIFIVGLRYIWYYKGKAIQITCFVLACITMALLLLYNMAFGDIENVIVLGMTGIIMLLINVIKNNYKYVILSTVILVLMLLYITMNFWLNIAWWVYLLIAGIVMIAVAIKKESEI